MYYIISGSSSAYKSMFNLGAHIFYDLGICNVVPDAVCENILYATTYRSGLII